jgi:DNA-binding NtrC family response regulator
VIMITAVVDTDTAVEAMKLGAYDYVTKPFNLDDLNMRVEKALERKRLIRENRDYQLHQPNAAS